MAVLIVSQPLELHAVLCDGNWQASRVVCLLVRVVVAEGVEEALEASSGED